MKIEDIFTGNKSEMSLNVSPGVSGESFIMKNNTEVKISFLQETYWLVFSEKDRFEIIGNKPEDKANLDIISSGQCIVLLVKSSKKNASLKAKLFSARIPITQKLEIGFGDIIADDIDKRYSRQVNRLKKEDWLEEELLIKGENSIQSKILVNNSPDDGGFRIFGKKIAIDVRRNKQGKLEISRILNRNKRHQPVSFIEVEIEIKDISQTGIMRSNLSQYISTINTTERYISTWNKYKEKEKEYKLKEVHKVGFITISEIKKTSEKNYNLFYNKCSNTINWLKIKKGSFIELCERRDLPNFDDDNIKHQVAKLVEKRKDFIIVETEDDFPSTLEKEKYACLSLNGDKAVQKRRENALDKIRNNSTPMPQLAGILEGIDVASIERRDIKPLTGNVKTIFGKTGPNEMQELALDKALNTPDIAIVQGPPGTGKTKVISALSERLVDLYKENGKSPEMNILLTAFQHDAVENMAYKTEVLGLPTIKIGKTKNQAIDTIDIWIKNKTEEIEAEQNDIEPNENELKYLEIKQYYMDYIETLNQDEAKASLKRFKRDNIAILPDEIIDEITSLTKTIVDADKEILNKLESLVRNVRTDKISYSDDGEMNLRRFLKNYQRYEEELPELSCKKLTCIENVIKNEDPDDADLNELDNIKLDYLNLLISSETIADISLPNALIEIIFKKIIDFFSERVKSHGSIFSVLSEYQQDLSSNNDSVKNTIKHYSALVASTVQGSSSYDMGILKEDPFDSVIVDEAARANPLDLLIPLTSAKRRIVLVGDHRQLPHLIDNAIQNELINDDKASSDASKHLEESLFERFYTILKKLEKKDGVTRVVTLNTQYRMHPVIGDFISRTFYEKYGDPKIYSGVPAEKLEHNINLYQDKVAVSINIPLSKGGEKDDNKKSKYRPVEAKEIIRRAKEILDSDPNLSVGVITFYSGQVDEIHEEAKKVNLVEDEEGYKIAKKYTKTIDGEERFRIGSVDAFQGMEFDVVLLSLVRSNDIKTDIRKKYGFLTSYNRLNVAMSRAKKLLIAVGDEKMFETEQAKEHIYGLYAFYNELIGSEYGISI